MSDFEKYTLQVTCSKNHLEGELCSVQVCTSFKGELETDLVRSIRDLRRDLLTPGYLEGEMCSV